ncbi:MAG: methyltransferase domain-containing protein [candidate division NC10 bacterium]|nr:methyltransferase domain-containing protein [candidate division NC10 bacterium]
MGARSADVQSDHATPLAGTGWRIIQARRGYRYSVESLLLAHAADPQPGEQVLDLGAGNGAVTFLLAAKAPACRIFGLEIQEAMAERARRAVHLNGCEGRVEIVTGDLRRPAVHLAAGGFDLVVIAPPYWPAGGGPLSPVPEVAAARHEVLCSLAEVVAAAAYALAPAGRFWMIHRAARLAELVAAAEARGLRAIRVRPVRSRAPDRATFVLVRAARAERSSLTPLPPLTLYSGPGRTFSPDLRAVHAAFGRAIGEETA